MGRTVGAWRTAAAFLALSAVWGSSFFFIKIGLEGLSPTQLVLGRLSLGSVALIAIMALGRRRWPREARIWLHMLVVASALAVVPYTLFAWAERSVPSSLASIFNATTPVMTLLLMPLLLPGERLGRTRVTGLVIGLAGVVVLGAPWQLIGSGPQASPLAEVACLGATASYGFAGLYLRRFLSNTGHDPIALSAVEITLAAGIAWLLAPIDARGPMALDLRVVLAVSALGVLGTGLAYIWYNGVLREWGPARASTVTYLSPVVGVVLGVVLLGEPVRWNEPVGGLVVIAGILTSQGRGATFRRPSRPDEPVPRSEDVGAWRGRAPVGAGPRRGRTVTVAARWPGYRDEVPSAALARTAGRDARTAPHRSPRWLRSVRRRPVAFVFLLVLSALAVVVSVLTPMLLRSTQAVVLAQTVAAASWSDSHVVAKAQTAGPDDLTTAVAAVRDVTGALHTRGAWDAPVTAAESLEPYPWRPRPASHARIVYLSQAQPGCPGIELEQGRCPAKRHEALLAATTAAATGLGVGATIVLDPADQAYRVAVVGVYDDRHGGGAVLARPSALAGAGISRPEPAIAVGTNAAGAITGQWNYWSARRLRNPVTLTAVAGIRADLRRADAATLSQDDAMVAGSVTTTIGDLLDRIEADQTSAAVIAGAIGLQALGLAWFALAAVIGRISRDRAPEWGIGRTRGLPRGTWLTTVFLEPTVAVVAGAVAGLAAGIGLAQVVVRIGLEPTAVVEPWQPLVLACGALALLGSLVAIVAASVRSARLPLPALLRETTEPRQLSRVALVAQVGAVLLTAVVLWVVVTQRQTGVAQIGLLAPALVAVVIALAALRLTVVVVRRGTRRPTRSLAGLVVGRQFARAPSVLASAVLVAVGVALTAYTLQVGLVADRLSVAQADAAVGAAKVLTVAAPAGTDLVAAVDRADPGGRAAMAAAETTGPNARSTDRIVAVDASRLAAITTWRPAWRGTAGAALAARLDPPVGPDLVLRGSRLRLTVAHLASAGDGVLAPGLPKPGTPQLRLRAVVATDRRWVTVPLGELRNGTAESARGAFPCTAGCRLVSISVADPEQTPPVPYGAIFQLTGIATDQQSASSLSDWTRDAGRWRNRIATAGDPAMPARIKVASDASGLIVNVEDDAGDLSPTMEPANGPAVLPALPAAAASLTGFAGLRHVVVGSDLAQAALLLHVVGTAPVLPRSLDDGVLVDLSQMRRIADPARSDAVEEVWLAPGAHPAVLARLAAEGVRITAASTLADAVTANERRAPPAALRLSLATAVVAALLTLLGLVAARVASLPGKLRDWRTLLRTGVTVGRLRRLATVDAVGPPAVGALLGVLGGLVAYLATVRRLPLLPSDVGHPPVDWTPSFAALGLLAVAAVAVVVAIGVVGAAVEVREAAR